MEKAGFEIMALEKLTTGLRAIIFLMERYVDTASYSRRTLLGVILLDVSQTPVRRQVLAPVRIGSL